jgi:hypothetical protein
MSDSLPIRFHKPGSQFGKKCDKCGGKMKGHMWIDIDDRGRVTRCSVSEGIQKKP